MSDAEVLRRAAQIAKSEGKHVIEPSHLRRAERELGHDVKVSNK